MKQEQRLEALQTRARELQFAAKKSSGKQRLKHLAGLSKIQQQIAGITDQTTNEQKGTSNG